MSVDSLLLYVGTYSEPIRFASGKVLDGGGRGIHIFRLDASAGTLTEVAAPAPSRNPSYLAFDPSRRFLYAVSELKEFEGSFGGGASAFALDRKSGALAPLNTVATHGTDPCHLAVDRSGRHLLIANYSSGHVTVLPIRPDGALGDASQVIAHVGSSVDPVRQTGPHPHHVVLDDAGARAFVADLGLDKIVAYRFDPTCGKLTPDDPPFVAMPAGSGPRQTVLNPSGGNAYVLNELGSSVTVCSYDARSGRLVPGRTVSTLPHGFSGRSTCAEAQIAPSGKFLYASNRGHNSLTIFAIEAGGGDLRPLGHVATGGAIPRCFDLSPSGNFLAAANQDSNNVVLFRVDPKNGGLTPTGSIAPVGTPVCVRFL
jgi:6-phosphogluconolactonase